MKILGRALLLVVLTVLALALALPCAALVIPGLCLRTVNDALD